MNESKDNKELRMVVSYKHKSTPASDKKAEPKNFDLQKSRIARLREEIERHEQASRNALDEIEISPLRDAYDEAVLAAEITEAEIDQCEKRGMGYLTAANEARRTANNKLNAAEAFRKEASELKIKAMDYEKEAHKIADECKTLRHKSNSNGNHFKLREAEKRFNKKKHVCQKKSREAERKADRLHGRLLKLEDEPMEK